VQKPLVQKDGKLETNFFENFIEAVKNFIKKKRLSKTEYDNIVAKRIDILAEKIQYVDNVWSFA
jgi:hypothetical protein